MIKDCQRTAAMVKIAELRGIQVSAMRDQDLLAVDAITEEGIQTVFKSLSKLLDIAEAAIQHSELNEQARAWFEDEIAALVES